MKADSADESLTVGGCSWYFLYCTDHLVRFCLSQKRADSVLLLKAPLSQCSIPLPLLNMLGPGCHNNINYAGVNVKQLFSLFFLSENLIMRAEKSKYLCLLHQSINKYGMSFEIMSSNRQSTSIIKHSMVLFHLLHDIMNMSNKRV